MCEYCGCRSLESVEQLTLEHETAVNLISRVRDAHRDGEIACMAELARDIAGVLRPHIRVEELGLFPAPAPDFPDKIAALEGEHRRIEAVLAEEDGPFPTGHAWSGRLMAVLDLLRGHILKEQDGVLPAAPAYLSTEQWETVEAVRVGADDV